ncbi:MAG: neutral/alkaline non-lysosomal ceramidase N-terminal domain-containing protein [Phycisphaerae bacterium]|nr:neutral/alkaline non-lysosomal ceramidase N-terminal domain-containing protein [Phycisphaerae bacterium]
MLAGFAQVDITPPVASRTDMYIPILGWPGRRGKLVEAVRDPLHAKAMAVSDGERRAVFVTCDSLGDHVGYSPPARERISLRTGLNGDDILIVATHAHTTPETCDIGDRPVDPRWVAEMSERIAQAVTRAVDGLRPAHLRLVSRETVGLNANRRRDDRPCDREMAALVALTDGHEPFGALIFFAAHPTTVQVRPYFSADYVGHAMSLVEGEMGEGFVGLFANGCCGDVRPEAPEDESGLVRQGDAVGQVAVSLIRDVLAGSGRSASGPVRTGVRRATVHRHPLPSLEDLLAERDCLVEELGGSEELPIEDRWPEGRWADLVQLNERIALARGPERWEAPVRGLAIGELGLVTLPCEPLARVGEAIKHGASAPGPLVAGYSDPMLGYVGMRADYAEGGYETVPSRWSRLGPGSGEVLAASALEVLKELHDG